MALLIWRDKSMMDGGRKPLFFFFFFLVFLHPGAAGEVGLCGQMTSGSVWRAIRNGEMMITRTQGAKIALFSNFRSGCNGSDSLFLKLYDEESKKVRTYWIQMTTSTMTITIYPYTTY